MSAPALALGETTFLAGSGISIASGLPSGMDFNRAIARGLSSNARQAARVERLLVTQQGDAGAGLLRFEQLIALLRDVADPELALLDIFDAPVPPGRLHHFLARALGQRACVLTTNFDSLIERAFHLQRASHGMPRRARLAVAFLDQRSRAFPGCSFQEFVASQLSPVLFKLHGTLSLQARAAPRTAAGAAVVRASIGATLEAIGDEHALRLEPFKHRVLQRVTSGRTLVVLGYSGIDDFDVVPSLASVVHGCRQLIWLVHGDEPLRRETSPSRLLPGSLVAAAEAAGVPVIALRGPTAQALARLFGAAFPAASVIPSISGRPDTPVSASAPALDTLVRFTEGQRALLLGRLWQRRSRYARAIRYFARASRERHARRATPLAEAAVRLQADCYFEMGETRKAQALLDRLRSRQRTPDMSRARAADMAHRARLLRRAGRPRAALDLCRLARRRLASVPDTHYVTAVVLEAELDSALGHGARALASMRAALARCRTARYRLGIARCLMELSKLHRRHGDRAQALAAVREAQALFTLLGEAGHLGAAHLTEGNIHLDQGALDDAVRAYRRSIATTGRRKRRQGAAVALANLAIIWRKRGAWGRATRLFERSLAINRAIGNVDGMANDTENLAIMHLFRGEVDAADRTFAVAASLYAAIGRREGIAINLANRATSARLRGDLAAARGLLDQALAMNRRLRRPIGLAVVLQERAEVAYAAGDWRDALRLLGRARRFATAGSYLEPLVDCHELDARIQLHARGQTGRALARLHEAIDAARRMGADRRARLLARAAARLARDAAAERPPVAWPSTSYAVPGIDAASRTR